MAVVSLLTHVQFAAAQDSINVRRNESSLPVPGNRAYQLSAAAWIIPAALVGYGTASLRVNELKQLNVSTRDEINEHQPAHISLDNYTQYAPAVIVCGLNAAGIKGRHNFRDRTILYATSQLISAAFVVPLKHIVQEERPDGSNKRSFPSGHTATAFSSAQFMFREYRGSHFWLSISGYSFAIFTGVYRTLNDKHWVGDVMAGAGFGILSTELAYWLFPWINGLFTGKGKPASTMIIPVYQYKSLGIGLVKNF
ncbi:MAG: phosphatase PAP2 family protein [Chitinophagaceae bacterium]|nr:phosphatase PAP2 family protein [Chitinophagaceae bacterium]